MKKYELTFRRLVVVTLYLMLGCVLGASASIWWWASSLLEHLELAPAMSEFIAAREASARHTLYLATGMTLLFVLIQEVFLNRLYVKSLIEANNSHAAPSIHTKP